MAIPSAKLIKAIRKASEKLSQSSHYQWGHMGACNCGFLAQEVTMMSKGQIHDYAMRGYGDWTDQVESYCPTSSMPMDLLISELISSGLSLEDLVNLERLKDKTVLQKLSKEERDQLRHNNPKHVSIYMEKWADVLEEKKAKSSKRSKELISVS